MSPRLSVVIPSYNSAPFIEETMRSILRSDELDMEVIVSDHSSTDGTWERLQQFAADPRVSLTQIEKGGGAPRNWNAVTERASGELIKLVCGDDVLLPGTLERQVALLDANPEATLTACRRNLVDARGKSFMKDWGLKGLNEPMTGPEVMRAVVQSGGNLLGEPACVMMRRAPLVENGLWNPEIPYLIDLASYTRVLLPNGGFVPDLHTGATFRISSGQWSVALSKSQSQQYIAFTEWVQRTYPGVVTDADRRASDRKARMMELKRRGAYLVLRSRMS